MAKGERVLRNFDMTKLGGPPDCSRSRSDGFANCGRYRMIGNTVAFADAGLLTTQDWEDPMTFVRTKTGFTLDEVDFMPIAPMDPSLLAGVWVAESFTGSGRDMGGGVGVYNNADIFWNFAKDRQFERRQSVTTTTMITPDPILGGASGGGSSIAVGYRYVFLMAAPATFFCIA